MHGSNRLGGNSLSDLSCSASGPARRPRRTPPAWRARPAVADAESGGGRAGRAGAVRASGRAAENPYTIQQDLQQTMNDLVGIIRTREELEQSLEEIEKLKERAKHLEGRG